jgi:hypothetical protein
MLSRSHGNFFVSRALLLAPETLTTEYWCTLASSVEINTGFYFSDNCLRGYFDTSVATAMLKAENIHSTCTVFVLTN